MDFLDHGNCPCTTRKSRDTPAVGSDDEQSYLPAAMEPSLDHSGAKRAQNLSWNGAERIRFPDSCFDYRPPVKNAWQEPGCLSLAPSNTTQPTLDFLLSRIQALENEVRSPRSVVAQHPATYEQHVSCPLGTQSFPLSTLTTNTPYAIAGPEPTLTQARYGLQDEGTAGIEYDSSIITHLHLNNAVATSSSGLSPVAAGDPDNLHVNPGVNAGDHHDDQSATIQDWDALLMINNEFDNGNFIDPMVDLAAPFTGTQASVDQSVAAGPASQMIGNSGYNSYSELEPFDDMIDYAGAYLPSGIGAAVGDSSRGATQADVRGLGNVSAPNNTASLSSANGRARTSRSQPHRCNVSMQCHKRFARRADRDRHALTHDQNNIRTFSCPSAGCIRVGASGFWRLDKYKEHRAKLGH